MSIAEAIAEAKADLASVQNKTLSLIKEQERMHRKDRRSGDIVGRRAYTSPGKNNWLCVTTTNKKHTLQNFLMYFHAKEGFFALQPSYEGLSFLFTPHFLMRYRERSGHGAPTAIENLTAFFYRNSATTAMRTGKEHLGFPAFIGAVPDGYVLGTLHYDEGYHRCRTFVSHDQAFPNQEEQWEGLAALHELQTRYPKLFAQLKGGVI
ncbi:MAG: hypothetical protein IPP83_08365 [Flavobacteriales bacterium]|nr:hypothetical protein [Flavobacteriales bacterium]